MSAQLILPGLAFDAAAQLRFPVAALAEGRALDEWADPAAPFLDEHLGLLGHHARDWAGWEGTVVGITFDLREMIDDDEVLTSIRFIADRPGCTEAWVRFAKPPGAWAKARERGPVLARPRLILVSGGRHAIDSGGLTEKKEAS